MMPLLMMAAAWTTAVPGKQHVTRSQISSAAAACGTHVSFVDLPKGTQPLVKTSFGYNLDPHASQAQRQCFYKQIPTTRIGFITSPSVDRPAPAAVDANVINSAIQKACKLPASKAHFYREGGLDHLRMAPNPNYNQVKCAYEAATAAGAHLPHALVGKIS